MNKNLLVTVVCTIVFASGGFYAGIQYQKSKTGNFIRGQFQSGLRQPTGNQTRNGVQNQRPFGGEITEIGENTITLKTQDGSYKIVVLSDTTKINKASEGSKADLKVGEKIAVFGTEGTNKTVTAQTMTLGDVNFFGMQGGR